MGIPSFYKHLLQTVGGLTHRDRPPPQVFALDLNCAIYYCTRKLKTPYSPDIQVRWEDELIQEVLGYIRSMVRIVKPSESVYIAVDGVAPMAKIKQQRMRRFKSAILAEEEARVKAEAGGQTLDATKHRWDPPCDHKSQGGMTHETQKFRWDTNAITPGTKFMNRLTSALRSFRLPDVNIIPSPADEAGEGEQKIMAWLRNNPQIQNVVVYGLDADLIVLSMLEHGQSGRTIHLFREETEFNGSVKSNALGEEQYLFLDICHLSQILWQKWKTSESQTLQQFLLDFVGIMNLLGNDFLPHSMSLKIHDEGIERVLAHMKLIQSPLITNNTYSISTLRDLFKKLGEEEEHYMIRGIRRKLDTRIGSSAGSIQDPQAKAVALLNDKPIEWAAEKVLVEQKTIEGCEKPRWMFRPDWKSLYYQHGLWSSLPSDIVNVYCSTLVWALQYYIGLPVDMTWYYPWYLPPLFEDIAHELELQTSISPPCSSLHNPPLKPIEQLAMVLPQSSFHLLPPELQRLPTNHIYAWPQSWGYFSLGRRFLWECEPQIPLIQPSQIRIWIEECLEND